MEECSTDDGEMHEIFKSREGLESDNMGESSCLKGAVMPSDHNEKGFISDNVLLSSHKDIESNLCEKDSQNSTSHDPDTLKGSSQIFDSNEENCSQNSWNYEIYYKSFQTPQSNHENNMPQSSEHFSKKNDEKGSFDVNHLKSTPVQKDSNSSCRNYSPDDEVLCIEVQRSADEVCSSSHSRDEKENPPVSVLSSDSTIKISHEAESNHIDSTEQHSAHSSEKSCDHILSPKETILCMDSTGAEHPSLKSNSREDTLETLDECCASKPVLYNEVENAAISVNELQIADVPFVSKDELHVDSEGEIMSIIKSCTQNIHVHDSPAILLSGTTITNTDRTSDTLIISENSIDNSVVKGTSGDVKRFTPNHTSGEFAHKLKDLEISFMRGEDSCVHADDEGHKIETSSFAESFQECNSSNSVEDTCEKNENLNAIRDELKDLELSAVHGNELRPSENLSTESSDVNDEKLRENTNVPAGFSQIPEPDVSLEEADAYLDAFSRNKVAGHELQIPKEDMNGNLSLDAFCQEQSLQSSCKSQTVFQTPEHVQHLTVCDETELQGLPQGQFSGITTEAGNQNNQALSTEINVLCERYDISNDELNSKEYAMSLSRGVSKKDILKHTCNDLVCNCDISHEMDLSCESDRIGAERNSTVSSSISGDDVCVERKSMSTSAESSVEPEEDFNENILNNENEVPDTRLVFSPVDGIFRSVPYNEPVSRGECSNSNLTVEGDFSMFGRDTDNNAYMSSENQHFSSRLQRPTTLDLPCCTIFPTQGLPSQPDFMPPPVAPVIEEPPVGTLVDLDDISPSAPQMNVAARNFCQANDKLEVESQESLIGYVKPFWIPDSEAANCMHCNMKFTVIKRRHHCRACGKVLCSRCCNQKARLPYLLNKEDRVCQQCFEILSSDANAANSGESPASSSCGSSPSFSPPLSNANAALKGYWKPHPNNPDDYCSTVSPLQQMQQLANRPPPTVMVPVGVLKRGNKPRGEPKQVIFSDGIRPGGDLTDLTEPMEVIPPYQRQGRRRVDKISIGGESSQNMSVGNYSSAKIKKKSVFPKSRHKRVVVSDSEGSLPTVLLPHDDPTADDRMDIKTFIERLKDELSSPVIFAIIKNLHILTKIIKLDCCFGKECWCFASQGLCTVGQDEVIFLLERYPDEEVIPRDAFRLFNKVYDNATKGSTVGDLGYLIFSDGIFGSWDHRGFLFVRPTFQCLRKLVLPGTPFLCAILIQKWEVPWAKVFPLRLMLRLGAECRYYPCSLVSIRSRKPVYFEIGQTIMNVLADLRNYQFTIPFVPGLVVHMEEKKTSVIIPRNRYEQLMKVMNSNNVEHVLALGANFSSEADSHLVCMQKDEGDYHTQAINIEHTPRKVTGASFIVFSGALKSSTGLSAKFNIVEDGLLVQIPHETMTALHSALHDMHNLTINCGPVNAPEPEEVVLIQWADDDRKFNIGVASPVDGRSLEGIPSLRIHTSTDYAGDNYLIRWTEVFFMELDRNGNSMRVESIDPCKVAESVAQAFCVALIPYLDSLAEAEMTRIGLRVILDAERDKVEYEAGALGKPLPAMYMNALDSSLIPIISRVTGASHDEPIALELIFYILIK